MYAARTIARDRNIYFTKSGAAQAAPAAPFLPALKLDRLKILHSLCICAEDHIREREADEFEKGLHSNPRSGALSMAVVSL